MRLGRSICLGGFAFEKAWKYDEQKDWILSSCWYEGEGLVDVKDGSGTRNVVSVCYTEVWFKVLGIYVCKFTERIYRKTHMTVYAPGGLQSLLIIGSPCFPLGCNNNRL